MEPTGSDNSSQNGIAERPNRTYGDMMRTMLMGAGLDSRYWSYALVQSVFIKNRLPHSHHDFKMTPFQALTGREPNLQDLKIFGSRIIAKNPGQRRAKLDDHTSSGIFLHHTATTSINKYIDDKTDREKSTSHIDFDEAHYTTSSKPLGARALIETGYNNRYRTTPTHPIHQDNQQLKVKLLSKDAILPTKATDGSAGLDICSSESITIPPGELKLVSTDIAITCPPGTYGRLAPRSGLAMKRHIDIRAGVIDADYTGPIKVALHNIGTETQILSKHTKVAQLILEKNAPVSIIQTDTLELTARGSNGFGSTGETITSQLIVTQTPPVTSDPKPESHTSPQPIPFTPDELDKPTLHSFTDRIGDLWLSNDPFGPTLTMEIDVKGSHSTLGLQLDDNNMIGRLYLRHCEKSTPSARMPKWRTNLRNSSLIRINNQPVKSINEVKRLIAQARTDNIPKLQFTFATDERVSIHPEHGVPQLYFDQLNTLAAYLQEMKYDEQFIDLETNEPIINLLSKKRKSNAQYTRAELKKREDWPDWVASEFKQLDLYEMQNMFGLPVPRPKDANIINLLWAYSIKTDGTKKSRCVCNGSPKRKGTVTLAHTFAACLE